MDGSRFFWRMLLALGLLVGLTPSAWSQRTPPSRADQAALVCKVYSLADLTSDSNLAKWIADTIPNVIQPGTWSRGTLSYYPPAKAMVICHTAAAHSQVDAFLNDLRKAVRQSGEKSAKETTARERKAGEVVPAEFVVAPTAKPVDAGSAKGAYPIPPPAQAPKHLFHLIVRYEGDAQFTGVVEEVSKNIPGLSAAKEDTEKTKESAKPAVGNMLCQFIIRYEGDGLIDANVVELLKAYIKESAREDKPAAPAPAATTPPAAPTQLTSPPTSPAYYPMPTSYPIESALPSSSCPSCPLTSPRPFGSPCPAPAPGTNPTGYYERYGLPWPYPVTTTPKRMPAADARPADSPPQPPVVSPPAK